MYQNIKILFVNFCKDFSQNTKVSKKNADKYNTKDRDQKMAEAFNLNSFLNNYRTYTERQYTAFENAEAKMAEADIKRAEEHVKNSGLLTLTLSEKLAELGIGDRVLEQFADTAYDLMFGWLKPIDEYLKNHENIFDQEAYNAEIQAYAKQMFFSKQALSAESQVSAEGQNFVYTM